MAKKIIFPAGQGKKGFSGFPASQFTDLNDTPASYPTALDMLQVNAAKTALELIPGRGQVNGVASLDGSGKVPDAQIPDLAICDYLGDVANQAAMLALVGERGDWCTRTDTSTYWVLIADDPTLLASWKQLIYPATPVHDLGGGLHNADTIANLKSKISDASLITTADAEIVALVNKDFPVNGDLLLLEEGSTQQKKKILLNTIKSLHYQINADQFQTPNNADWPVTNPAPADVDSVNNAVSIRKFDDTTEQAIGFLVNIPNVQPAKTFIDIAYRAQSAPGPGKTAQLKLYIRNFVGGGAVGAWSAGTLLTPLAIPNSTYWTFLTGVEIDNATYGLSSWVPSQFCLSRVGTDVNDTLTGDLNILAIQLRFGIW